MADKKTEEPAAETEKPQPTADEAATELSDSDLDQAVGGLGIRVPPTYN